MANNLPVCFAYFLAELKRLRISEISKRPEEAVASIMPSLEMGPLAQVSKALQEIFDSDFPIAFLRSLFDLDSQVMENTAS